jgi:hypothetical protein
MIFNRARLSASSHLPPSKIDNEHENENEHDWEQTREAPVRRKSSPTPGITNADEWDTLRLRRRE